MGRYRAYRQLAEQVDKRGSFVTGFQIVEPRKSRNRAVPVWAQTRQALEAHILAPARKRFRIAYQFWIAGYAAADIARAEGMSIKAVECLLRRLRKPSEARV